MTHLLDLFFLLVLWNSSSKYSFIDDMELMSSTCPCSESSKSSSAFLYLSLLSMISRTAWLTATIRQHKLWSNKWVLSFTLKENSKTWFCTSCLLIMDNQGGGIPYRHWWKQTDDSSIATAACKTAKSRKRKCARPPLAFKILNTDMMWHMSPSVTLPPQSKSCLSLGG